jgi:hypothetical protein
MLNEKRAPAITPAPAWLRPGHSGVPGVLEVLDVLEFLGNQETKTCYWFGQRSSLK